MCSQGARFYWGHIAMSVRRKRVIVILPHLGIGGAQRVGSCMADHLAAIGHDVTVVTILSKPPADFYRLSASVNRVLLGEHRSSERSSGRLSLPRAYYRRFRLRFPRLCLAYADIPLVAKHSMCVKYVTAAKLLVAKRLVKLIGVCAQHKVFGKSYGPYAVMLRYTHWRARAVHIYLKSSKPDVVLSLLGSANIITVAASHGLPHRVVISERNDPSRQTLSSPWEELRPLLYPGADVVTANSWGALDSMRAYCPAEKLAYLPNPLILNNRIADNARSNSFLFLGRLVDQKAPEILLKAFALVSPNLESWRLHFAGDGPMAERLKCLAKELKVEDYVSFHGLVQDPTALLKSCKVFVLPSRFEGTPNALLEAMGHGMPCIISDASPGPLKLVEHRRSGLVVKTGCPKTLADALHELAVSEELRTRLSQTAFERVREFGLDVVAATWENILFRNHSIPDKACVLVSTGAETHLH